MAFGALNLRHRSLPRGTLLVLGSLIVAFFMAGFPDDQASLKLIIPALAAGLGTWDTIRCLQRRWNLYHGAVVMLISMDIKVVAFSWVPKG